MFNIKKLSTQFNQAIEDKINQKTKPLGALGQLETLASKLATIQSHKSDSWAERIDISKPSMFVFAADHGIAVQGVSIAPSAVTQQMVINFALGGAAVNVFCRQFGWQLDVIDAGMIESIANDYGVKQQRLGCGTSDFSLEPAMTLSTAQQGIELGAELISQRIGEGADLIAFGEMGIGNTSSAAAIMAAILGLSAQECVGAGTGIDAATLERKQQLIQQALDLHKGTLTTPINILAAVGGFEIAQICGGILAAAQAQVPVLIDGFICTAAAMLAKQIAPNVQDYLIFAHCSEEQGHRKMLQWFNTEALLTLNMRLGEGSGAAIALPIVQAAAGFYNDMASFAQADVDDVVN